MQYYSLKDLGIAGKTKEDPNYTPTTVVASAYDTSGSGGRKLVKLSNGWLVAVAKNGTLNAVFYVSKDNGTTFTPLCNVNIGANPYIAIASNGTMVFAAVTTDNWLTASFFKFDAATVTNTVQTPISTIDSGQSGVWAGISLVVDSTGALHAAWASKNATYANSFNIRYSKSTDSGATWAAVTQVCFDNSTGYDHKNPCIVTDLNNNVHILHDYSANGSNYTIVIFSTAFTTKSFGSNLPANWGSKAVYEINYMQTNPCAIVDSSNVLHVVWEGAESGNSAYNIRYSKSSDKGSTWSTMLKLSNEPQGQTSATITCDTANRLYVLWSGWNTSGTQVDVRKITYQSAKWGTIEKLTTTGASVHKPPQTPAAAADVVRFIYKDSAVKYQTIPRPQVPDFSTTSIVETYIPLWMASFTAVATNTNINNNSGFMLADGASSPVNTVGIPTDWPQVKLFTFNASWPADRKFSLEGTVYTNSSAYSAYIRLHNITTNTPVSATQISTTSTIPTVLRSGSVTLTPGHAYGVTLYAGNGGTVYCSDAYLIALG